MKNQSLFLSFLFIGLFYFCSIVVNAAATPRVWAYDLNVTDNGDSYTFSFKSTATATSGKLIFYNETDTIQKIALSTPIIHGQNTETVLKSNLQSVEEGMNWAIQLSGDPITKVAEVTDQSRGIYDFYNTMGVVVDNDPESKHFSKIYIQQSYQRSSASDDPKNDGKTTRANDQTSGIFIYDQNLDELNKLSNVGIKPKLPDGYGEIGNDRMKFHRLNIDPNTGNLVFSYSFSGKPAVFAIDRENMTGPATNLLEDNMTDLTQTTAHCFDADGNLYVMDIYPALPNNNKYPGKGWNSNGIIYKYPKSGERSRITKEDDPRWANASITMASDGRGGLWVAQNRGQWDSYYQLVHVNSYGVIDYLVNNDYQHNFETEASYRGALAYDVDRQILAIGRGNIEGNITYSKIMLFKVTYDYTTGVPELTEIATTDYLNSKQNPSPNIDGLAFDYAGDLYVVASGPEKFYKFAVPTDNNTCTTPAKKSLKIYGTSLPRVFAYDLRNDGCEFSFKSNTIYTSGNIVFYNNSDEIIKKVEITSNPMYIHHDDIPDDVVNWGVELTGPKVKHVMEITDNNNNNHTLYDPRDIAIDNNPQSYFFGRIYVANPVTSSGYGPAGITVYDPKLNKVGEGYKASGTSLEDNNSYNMQRIAVDPTTGYVYYTKAVTNKTAIYELIPNKTNILSDGGTAKNIISEITDIKDANSLCFNDKGELYVLNNANYISEQDVATGRIYKITNGTGTNITTNNTEKYYTWASKDNALATDNKGGIWVAQNRNDWDGFYILSYVKSDGTLYKAVCVNKSSTDEIKKMFPEEKYTENKVEKINVSRRGHLAYKVTGENEGLLAFAGGGQVSVFKVTYQNDEPSLEKWVQTNIEYTTGELHYIDGVAFDYAGNLYVGSATTRRFYMFSIPTENNTTIVPARGFKKVFTIYHNNDVPNLAPKTDNFTQFEGGTVNLPIQYKRKLRPDTWETLCMPFKVDSVTVYDPESDTHYRLYAQYENNGTNEGYYWLRYFKTDAVTRDEFQSNWYDIEATDEESAKPNINTAYIIRVPGDYYQDKYVTFHGENNQNINNIYSEPTTPADDYFSYSGNNTMMPQQLTSAYVLDQAGYFRSSETSVTLYPFECSVNATRATIARMPRIDINGRGGATDIPNLPTTADDSKGVIYSVYGATVAHFQSIEQKDMILSGLPTGVYLVVTPNNVHKIFVNR